MSEDFGKDPEIYSIHLNDNKENETNDVEIEIVNNELDDVDLAEIIAASHEKKLSKKQLIIVLISMSISLQISFIDQASAPIIIPYMAKDLNASSTISWVGTSSLISNTVFMVLFGRFSDIFSRKYTMIAAMFILAFFDLACGLAKTPTQLYIFRGFCGVGNGGVSTLSMVIVSDFITLEQRGLYQGILGAFVGIGSAIGPFIASAFINYTSWRKFYFTLFPICLTSNLLLIKYVPYTKPNNSIKEKLLSLDLLGFLTSSISIIFFLIPISGGGSSFPWNSAFTISMIIIGGIFFFIFLIIEYKFSKLPLIPLNLFTESFSLSSILINNFFFGICYYGMEYYYPYYLEIVRDYSVLNTSCLLLSFVLSQTLASVLSGQLVSRTKSYGHIINIGYFLWFLSMLLLNLWNLNTKKGVLIIVMVINGLGSGSIFQPTLIAAQAYSFRKYRATVISTRNVLRCLGGSISLAISATILANTFNENFEKNGLNYFNKSEIDYLKTLIYSKIDLSNYNSIQSEYLKNIYMLGIKRIFYVWMASLGYCFITNLPIKDRGLQSMDEIDK